MADIDFDNIWDKTLECLRSELGEAEFSAWFTDIKFLRAEKNSIIIGFPSAFYRDHVKKRFYNRIMSLLNELAEREISLVFEIISNKEAKPSKTAKKSNTDSDIPKKEKNTVAENIPEYVTFTEKQKKKHPLLREDYIFEKYIIGEANSYAANAAHSISRNPGTAYNPFFIYGGVGLGKTHLMQAIGNYVYENSDLKVIYVTSEDFLNEFVQGYRDKESASAFKNKYRHTDVLLIDDIQFFQGKEGIQEEFFHTFNSLVDAKKQLVMTCDRPHTELKLSDRLVNRFELGIRADLQPPRYEMRIAILKSTAESRGANIPDEVIDLISRNISSNVRDLIGSLNNLIAYTEIMKQPVTLEIARQKLKDMFASKKQSNLSIEIIQKAVANFYRLSSSDLRGKKRNQKVALARQVAMFISREMTDYSTTEIGQEFGGKHHTTVMHSIEKIKESIVSSPELDSTIENIKRDIKDLSTK